MGNAVQEARSPVNELLIIGRAGSITNNQDIKQAAFSKGRLFIFIPPKKNFKNNAATGKHRLSLFLVSQKNIVFSHTLLYK